LNVKALCSFAVFGTGVISQPVESPTILT